MTATNHGLFGAAIAVTFSANPLVAILIAPFSHFLLDALPHFGDVDTRSKKFVKILTADASIAVITTLILAFVWSEIWWLVILCSFLAASPDLMWIYYEYINPKLKEKHLLPRFHSWIQWSQTKNGLSVEILWYFTFLSLLVFYGIKN